jgi:AmpD protein
MIKLSIDDAGWLQSVEVIRSPNFDARPDGTGVKLVVVHGISLPPGEYGGGHIQKFFCNRLDAGVHEYFESICSMTVSAHCLIERDGNVIHELEGCDHQAYAEAQYHSLAELIKALRDSYPDIDADAIAGHSDIAPGRKTDPGPAFDWKKLKQLV